MQNHSRTTRKASCANNTRFTNSLSTSLTTDKHFSFKQQTEHIEPGFLRPSHVPASLGNCSSSPDVTLSWLVMSEDSLLKPPDDSPGIIIIVFVNHRCKRCQHTWRRFPGTESLQKFSDTAPRRRDTHQLGLEREAACLLNNQLHLV